MLKGCIFDIKKYSIHDGPGIRTTVFFKGCSLACQWCHNPESQSTDLERIFHANRCIRCGACLEICAVGAISQNGQSLRTDSSKCILCGSCAETCHAEAREMVGRSVSVAEVMTVIQQDVIFYDESGGGVTISGGEPLMQPDFLLALLQASQKAQIHTVLDTCGYAPWDRLDTIRDHVDLFLYDLKLMDEELHRQFTGVSNQTILRNVQRLSQLGHDIILRVPVIPGITDGDDNIDRLAEFASGLPHLLGIELLPYHSIASDKYQRLGRDYALVAILPPSSEDLTRAAATLAGAGLRVTVGG